MDLLSKKSPIIPPSDPEVARYLKDQSYRVYQDLKNIADVAENKYAVGDFYIQFPVALSNDMDTAFPLSEEPASKYGGSWTEPFAAGSAFITPGADEQNEARTNGKQTHATQRFYGKITGGAKGFGYVGHTGVLRYSGTVRPRSADSSTGWAGDFYIDSSLGTWPATMKSSNTQTRVQNYLFKIWEKTAV